MKKFLLTRSLLYSLLVVLVKNTFTAYSLEISAHFSSSAMVLIMGANSINATDKMFESKGRFYSKYHE